MLTKCHRFFLKFLLPLVVLLIAMWWADTQLQEIERDKGIQVEITK